MKIGRIARLHSFSYVFLFLIRVLLWGKKKKENCFCAFFVMHLCDFTEFVFLIKKNKGLERAQQ